MIVTVIYYDGGLLEDAFQGGVLGAVLAEASRLLVDRLKEEIISIPLGASHRTDFLSEVADIPFHTRDFFHFRSPGWLMPSEEGWRQTFQILSL
tara:strand:- start:5 stop:286 length:282 start_codon:yes stop_codon:yes gene_type:complete